jgi:hypothetical protein
MKRILLIALSILLCNPLSAAIYKWTDEQGNVVYGDKPPSNETKQITPPPLTTYPGVKRQEAPAAQKTQPQQPEQEEQKVTEYTKIAIAEPSDNGAVRSNNGNVAITVVIGPKLDQEAGDQIRILLDGSEAKTEASTTITLENIDRGSHTVSAEVINRDGKVLLKTKPITFHLQRFSVKH